MNETKKASFDFENYKINSFSFNDVDNDHSELSVKFEPKGEYDTKSGLFILTFSFKAFLNDGKSELLNVILKANFKFREVVSLEDIPSYFYRNSIAIVFPYLRAFVTTLTAIGNTKPLILPVLNLTGLEQPFKDNTKIIDNLA